MNPQSNNANDPASQLALRQLREELGAPRAWAAMAGVALILALAGPFETHDRLTFGPRLAYWAVLVVATYSAGVVTGTLIAPRLARWLRGHALTAATGIATGIAVSAVVLLINRLAFPDWTPSAREVVALSSVTLPIAVIVTFLLRMIEEDRAAPPAETGSPRPALLDRLPLDKRGLLVSLTVEDHYTRVRTTQGEDLVLLRLTDAIREAAPEPGLRVHRSHWVATAAVTAARREGDRAVLTMRSGPDIPVSRANIPAIKSAGLLP